MNDDSKKTKVFLNCAEFSKYHNKHSQYLCRCYSDNEVIIENTKNPQDTKSVIFKDCMVHAKFIASENSIFLILSDNKKLYITFMNSTSKFFDHTSKVKLQNQSFIQNFDGIILGSKSDSDQILIIIGHYDGLYSFIQRTLDHEFVETKLKIENYSNIVPYKHSAVLQVFIDESNVNQPKLCISHANGFILVFSLISEQFKAHLKLEHSIVTNILPLDIFLYDKTLIIGTKGSIQVFGGPDFSIMKSYTTFSQSIICSLLILKDKFTGFCVYFGDEKGRIYEMSQKEKSKHEVIEIIGELNSFIVGCGIDRSNGKIIFYDRLNSCIHFE
eukprot:gene6169-10176_t